MLRKLLISAAAIAMTSPAFAAFVVTFPSTQAVPTPQNNFQGNLAALGLTQFASTGATIATNSSSLIKFEFFGSESGFNDTFSTTGAGAISFTENSNFTPFGASQTAFQSFIGPLASLAGILNFSATGATAQTATVGQNGFAIFTNQTGAGGFMSNVLWFGYDDSTMAGSDNHDDMIIRATIVAVPEPATWAMMVGGVGIAGMALRRRRRVANATVMA